MANRRLEEGFPLNGVKVDYEVARLDPNETECCFLSPFRCGARTHRTVALVHLGWMTFASLASFLGLIALTIFGSDEILFYIGLYGGLAALAPMLFIGPALFAVGRRKHLQLILPLVGFLILAGLGACGLFGFLTIMSFASDTNMQVLLVLCFLLSALYFSHAVRVMLRVREDLLKT